MEQFFIEKQGPILAGSSGFFITIQGIGGHGAQPKGTVDAVLATSQLVIQLNTIISRNLSPLENGVITVGKVRVGNASNVIAETGIIEGTIRWFEDAIYDTIIKRITQCVHGIEESFQVKCTIKFSDVFYPPTINHDLQTDNVITASKSVLPKGVMEFPPMMGSEDFSFFLQQRKGSFFFVSCGVESKEIYAHHSPSFQVDERSLLCGVQVFVNLALLLLNPNSYLSLEATKNDINPNGNNDDNNNNNNSNIDA